MKSNLELQAERNQAARRRLAAETPAPPDSPPSVRPPSPRPDYPSPAEPGGCWCGAPHPAYEATTKYTRRHARFTPGQYCQPARDAGAAHARNRYKNRTSAGNT